MLLYQTQDGRYLAKTQYGEWQAKLAGFTWNTVEKVWQTTDPVKAQTLAKQTGLVYAVPAPIAVPVPQQGDLWPTVREGRYAVVDPQDRVLKFYRVDKPTEGKWSGFTFLKVYASDVPYPIKDRATKTRILDEIAKAPLAALALYGQQIGKCGVCGLTLTDEESRKLGIGPICRGKLAA